MKQQTHRHPPLKGGVNFRDFGGYDTADGRRVKWRKLFRSGHLSGLTEDDHGHLDSLDLGAICDFRTDWENEREPTKLPAHLHGRVVRFHIWPKAARTVGRMMAALAKGETTEGEIYESQNIVYRQFVEDFSDRYAAMFRHILAAEGRAVLIHCAGGKDRTGLGAALLHVALGVPEQIIHDDYILTNRSDNMTRFIRDLAYRGAAEAGITAPAEAEAVFARFMRLFGARADSLQAAFDAVHAQAGSFDAYFRDVLGLSDAARAQLKHWYVEPA